MEHILPSPLPSSNFSTPAPVPKAHSHEQTDVSTPAILIFTIALGVFVLVICAVCWWLMRGAERRLFQDDLRSGQQTWPLSDSAAAPPEPQLQPTFDSHPTKPFQDLQIMRDHNRQILSGYGWTDRDTGVARIPMDRAIDLIVQNGLQPRLPATSPSTQSPAPTTALTPTPLPRGGPAQ